MDFHANDLIGSYRVVRELGRGGMAAVYEVVHAASGERLALKAFALDHGDREFLRRRFLAEARLLARLDCPRLVRVREVGVAETDGTPYFVLDLVLAATGEPMTLADAQRAGRLDERTVLGWYRDLRLALAHIHAQSVVHRDVKLENALVDARGRAMLADFGVARILDAPLRRELAVSTTSLTGMTPGTRPVMGTHRYLAPEIRRGGEATPAGDWYALGIALYRLLTGLWYEPNTRALDLLEPFSRTCRRTVRRLLADDPALRIPPADEPDPTRPRSAFQRLFHRKDSRDVS